MTEETDSQVPAATAEAAMPAPARPLSEAARRALAEAEARRAGLDARRRALEERSETNGREGPEPVRYGDWEVKGIATDF